MDLFTHAMRGLARLGIVPPQKSPAISASLPLAEVPDLPGVRFVAPPGVTKSPIAGLPASRRAEIEATVAANSAIGADGMNNHQRLQLVEAQIRLDFGLEDKLAGVRPTDSGSIRAEFAKYRSNRLKGITGSSLPALVAALPIVAQLNPIVAAAKVAAPAPATDKEGVPVKAVPAEPAKPAPDAELNFTDILTDLGQKLDEQFKNLTGADDPDDTTAKAMAVLRSGDSGKALNIMSAFAEHIRGKHAMSKLHGKERVVAAFKSQLEGRGTQLPGRSKDAWIASASLGIALAEKLPAPSDNPARGVDLNTKYRAALAALDTEIEACAAKGHISQELLGRRNRVNREWLAINRRKN